MLNGLIETYLKLTKEDLTVLKLIEKSSKRFQYVPFQYLKRISTLPTKEIEYHIEKLNRLELIRAEQNLKRYRMTIKGYDCLALRSLVSKNLISSIGGILDVGKESDIYMAISPEGKHLAVKFMRIGRTSFKQVRRVRDYGVLDIQSWYKACCLAARKEFIGLKKLYKIGVKVPEPISFNRHVVVMSSFKGFELSKVVSIDAPEIILDEIINNLKLAFKKAKIIHGDLSEYNVLVNNEGEILIIDWAQWITVKHASWKQILIRDISNITNFFSRKFNVKVDINNLIKEFLENTDAKDH